MLYRLLDWGRDLGAIQAAVRQLEIASPKYGYSQEPSVHKTMSYIRQHSRSNDAYIVDEAYLLLVGTAEPWHGNELALEERLVLRLHNGSLTTVPVALESIARERGVNCILASDSSINFRMGTVYKRAGFKPITITYYKELSWDNGSLS